MTFLNPLAQEQIARLHRECVEGESKVLGVLRRAASTTGSILTAGVSRNAAVRRCVIEAVEQGSLSLSCPDFLAVAGRHYYFTLEVGDDEFFFVSRLGVSLKSRLEFEIPKALFRSERREALRSLPADFGLRPIVTLFTNGRQSAILRDASRDGLGIAVQGDTAGSLPSGFELEVAAESGERRRMYAEIRNQRASGDSTRYLGLSVSEVPSHSKLELERAHAHFEGRIGWKRAVLAGQVARVSIDRVWRTLEPRHREAASDVIRFKNQLGQDLVGLVNSTGVRRGAPVVLIPPAWGKTKETLLPLALTLVETCRRAGRSVSVLRFDGTNRRGESFVDHDCNIPGEEYRRFRFSQAVQDLRAALRFVQESDSFKAPSCVVVSFSLSTIETRRVVAEAGAGEIAGWIPVVGMVDLQSGLRAVSGGVDYAEGILKGVQFGRHELVGVLADMDLTGRDALDAKLVFREDARRDMARIQVPITWIHGEHDGWIDVQRVLEVLRAGFATNRRLIRVPTGHQLRSSQEAFRTFELIASEAVRMIWGDVVSGRSPALWLVDRLREGERKRRDRSGLERTDLRSFWRSYLLGRFGSTGMDLFTATSTYREMMERQIALLAIGDSDRILDLGSGTGGFLRELKRTAQRPSLMVSVDFIVDALKRSRMSAEEPSGFVQADLDGGAVVPFVDGSFDAILASLVVSYLRDPNAAVAEIRRLLRPGGRVVLSSLRKDADISAIYSTGVAELVASGAERRVTGEAVSFAEDQRSFLNAAARLVDLEEQGLFRFYDADELRALMSGAGLHVLSVQHALGEPPQASIVVAERPAVLSDPEMSLNDR